MNRYTSPAVLRTVAGTLERHCGGCDRWLPWTGTNFHHSRANKSGLVSRCKRCMCAAQVTRNHARQLGQIKPYAAHADDGTYWVRYRVRNAMRAGKALPLVE